MRILVFPALVLSICTTCRGAADDVVAEAPVAPHKAQGPFELTWRTPQVESRNFRGSVHFSRDSSRLLVAVEGVARAWDTRTWRPIGPGVKCGDWISYVVPDAACKRLLVVRDIVGERDTPRGRVVDYLDVESRVWEVETGNPVGPAIRHNVEDVKLIGTGLADISADGALVATTMSAQGRVQVWRADTGEKTRVFDLHVVEDFKFDDEGATLTVLGYRRYSRGDVYRWDARTGEVRSVAGVGYFHPYGFANGRILVRAIGGFRVCEVESGKVLLERDHHYDKYDLGEMWLSGNGARAAVSYRDSVEVWDVDVGKQLSTIRSDDVMAIDPRGSVIVTMPLEGAGFMTRLWDADTGAKVRDLGALWSSVAFSPDGNLLAMMNHRVITVIRADPRKAGPLRWSTTILPP